MRTFRLTLMISGTLWIALQAQAASPVLTTLYNFKGGSSDGANPDTGVTIGPGGALFGNTAEGGASDNGVLFALTPPASPGGTWTETAHAFPYYTGGAYGLVAGPSALYGTTFNGGTSGSGTVYSIALLAGPGQGRVLYEFSPGADGVNPKASATIGSGGVLYGPTYEDGANGCGTVFALTPPASAGGAWTESTIYSLTTNDGCGQLDAALVIGSGGVIYAADEIGGPAGVGRVFSLTPPAAPGGAWTHTVLYDFKGPSDGIYPVGLTLSDGGVIYGAANRGGPHGFGTVFSLTPPSAAGGAWTETTLYSFTGAADGDYPFYGVVIGHGVLYGTTGYAPPDGNIYSLTPPATPGGAWTEVSLHNFTNGSDGGNPSGVVIDSAGVLYGTTYSGGSSGDGTVFSVTP